MLNLRCQTRLAQETLMGVLALGDLGPDDFDDARGAEERVLDFVDFAHAAGAEAIDDLVFPVNGVLGVCAQEISDRLTAVRARLVSLVDLGFALETVEGHGAAIITSASACPHA